MGDKLDDFVARLHPSTRVLARGIVHTDDGRSVEGVLVRNLYGQEVVWGYFGRVRGKFKGTLANSANTEGINFEATNS